MEDTKKLQEFMELVGRLKVRAREPIYTCELSKKRAVNRSYGLEERS